MSNLEKAGVIADRLRVITMYRDDCDSMRGLIITPEEILAKCSSQKELDFYFGKLRKGGT